MHPFKPVHPLYERLRYLRGSILNIEAIIGGGKTTLGKKLTELLNSVGIPCVFLEEEVNTPLLELFLGDMKKYAFAFQLAMLKNRQGVYREAMQFARDHNGVAIVDRSLYGDIAFASMHHSSGNISDSEWEVYQNIVENTQLPGPSVVLYLDVYPQVAMDRIAQRNRGSEKDKYTIDYLRDLDSHYKIAMADAPVRVHYLDWNEPRTLVEQELLDVLDDVDP